MPSLLLVDDDSAVRDAVRLNLEPAGYTVTCAADGIEAERILDVEQIDVLLTDILMPNRDGLELIQAVRQKRPDLGIVAMSGGSGPVSADFCLRTAQAYRVDGLLRKPFAMKEMLSLLRTIVARKIKVDAGNPSASSSLRILNLEDSALDSELIHQTLSNDWPDICFMRVQTQDEFVDALQNSKIDLILSDYTLPGFGGLAALELARRWCPQTPFIFLSGTIGDEQAVEALHLGAADYLIKDRPARLTTAIRQALERRDDQARKLREDRMESIGMIAGGLVHDLNNILAPILMATQLLKAQGQRSDNDSKLLTVIENYAQHGTELIKQLLAFAKGREESRVELRADQQIAHLELMLKPMLGAAVSLRTYFPETPWPILADATQFNQVILNLCANARDAMPDGGCIEISTQNIILDVQSTLHPEERPGHYLRILIADAGTGIAPEIINKIFDPFFTTKPAGKGTGLGLAAVRDIVRSHGGFLRIESEVGRGTSFHVHFPSIAPDASGRG